MRPRVFFKIFVFWWMTVFPLAHADAENLDGGSDLRIVFELQGQHEKAEAYTFRLEMLKNIIKGLPLKTKAGIWTYSRYVNYLHRLKLVDDTWKTDALREIDDLGKGGAFNDLPQAINKSIVYWFSKKEKQKRYLIVIGSGRIVVSPLEGSNKKMHEYLLGDLSDKLRKLDVKVIVLSSGSRRQDPFLSFAKVTQGKYYNINDQKIAATQLPIEFASPQTAPLDPLLAQKKVLLKKKRRSTQVAAHTLVASQVVSNTQKRQLTFQDRLEKFAYVADKPIDYHLPRMALLQDKPIPVVADLPKKAITKKTFARDPNLDDEHLLEEALVLKDKVSPKVQDFSVETSETLFEASGPQRVLLMRAGIVKNDHRIAWFYLNWAMLFFGLGILSLRCFLISRKFKKVSYIFRGTLP